LQKIRLREIAHKQPDRLHVLKGYAQLLKDGSEPPPPHVLECRPPYAARYIISDGRHRIAAARLAGRKEIWAYVELEELPPTLNNEPLRKERRRPTNHSRR
jgi:hypothetical protein